MKKIWENHSRCSRKLFDGVLLCQNGRPIAANIDRTLDDCKIKETFRCDIIAKLKVKVHGKIHPRTGHGVPEALLFL